MGQRLGVVALWVGVASGGCPLPGVESGTFSCRGGEDCAAGYACLDGTCRPRCARAEDCDPGYSCDTGTGGCVADVGGQSSSGGASAGTGSSSRAVSQVSSAASNRASSSSSLTTSQDTSLPSSGTGSTSSLAPPSSAPSSSSGVPAQTPCNPADPQLALCYTFEEDPPGAVHDLSAHGNHAVAASVDHENGIQGLALRCGNNSVVTIPEAASMDPSTLTLEMWVNPTAIPNDGRAGLLDNDETYSLFIYPGGDLRCAARGVEVWGQGVIRVGLWTHVACAAGENKVVLYVNGVPQAWANSRTSGSGTRGSALCGNMPSGDPFRGRLDCVRLWSVVKSRDEIMAGMSCE